jgi:hypothetical protein
MAELRNSQAKDRNHQHCTYQLLHTTMLVLEKCTHTHTKHTHKNTHIRTHTNIHTRHTKRLPAFARKCAYAKKMHIHYEKRKYSPAMTRKHVSELIA